jgi:hypothetical protein
MAKRRRPQLTVQAIRAALPRARRDAADPALPDLERQKAALAVMLGENLLAANGEQAGAMVPKPQPPAPPPALPAPPTPAPLQTAVNGAAPTAADRGAGGKFVSGNKAARGNPHHRKMAALRRALLESATEERLRELGEQLYRAARAGDWAAAKLFLAYCVGKPAEGVDPDAVDLDEWRRAAASPTASEVAAAMIENVSPADALDLARRGDRPAKEKVFSDKQYTMHHAMKVMDRRAKRGK